MKLIVITGDKNSGKDYLASKLSENSDIKFIKPYSDKMSNHTTYDEVYDCSFIPINDKKLNVKMECEIPLFERVIGNNRYVVFQNQLNAEYALLILDKYTLDQVRRDYDFSIFSIYCTQGTCDNPQDYDVVFNPRVDDIDFLEVKLYE